MDAFSHGRAMLMEKSRDGSGFFCWNKLMRLMTAKIV